MSPRLEVQQFQNVVHSLNFPNDAGSAIQTIFVLQNRDRKLHNVRKYALYYES